MATVDISLHGDTPLPFPLPVPGQDSPGARVVAARGLSREGSDLPLLWADECGEQVPKLAPTAVTRGQRDTQKWNIVTDTQTLSLARVC